MRRDDEIEHIASRIGAEDAHGFKKHAHEFPQRTEHGEPLPVSNPREYEEHAAATLRAEDTKGFQTHDGREQYYNQASNTFVGSDPEHRDHGTMFRPKTGPDHYEGLKAADARYRAGRGLPEQPSVEGGGYDALQDRKQALASKDGLAPAAEEGSQNNRSALDRMDSHWSPPPPPPAEGQEETESRPRGRSR